MSFYLKGNQIPESTPQSIVCLIPLSGGHLAIIDAEDFVRVAQFKWFAKANKARGDKIYAARSQRDGSAVRTIFLHRFITNCPDGKQVDHKDTNRLNCRRSNLEVVTQQENMKRHWKKYRKE